MSARRRGGSVVITSSYAGPNAIPSTGAYVVSKHGTVELMRAFAAELAPRLLDTPFPRAHASDRQLGRVWPSRGACRLRPRSARRSRIPDARSSVPRLERTSPTLSSELSLTKHDPSPGSRSRWMLAHPSHSKHHICRGSNQAAVRVRSCDCSVRGRTLFGVQDASSPPHTVPCPAGSVVRADYSCRKTQASAPCVFGGAQRHLAGR
ncbi:SDR family oxidoreductase [Arthrobacter sp. NPDC080031]|uniref:SDR family oxidoreductase n=1 Tax=Arthrobacter sp. NPDC080031 TaxID=3155918 RepID=UPI00344FEB86